MTSVLAKDVCVRLGGRLVVDQVSLEAEPGEWVCVIGPNGAGKSSLLRALAGTLHGSRVEGRIEIGGRPIAAMSARERARHVAMVVQQPILPEAISVREYALLGRTAHRGRFGTNSSADHERVEQALDDLDAGHLADRDVHHLSGGERQRVLLARVLVQDAPVLFLDEPTTSLDVGHQHDVLELIDRLRRDRGITVVSTLHDLTLAARYPDRLVLLVEGRVRAAGGALDVLTEEHLAGCYGASVRVLCVEDGIVIVPRRPAKGDRT